VASESSNPEAILTLKLTTESGDPVLLPLSEQTTRQLQQVISEFNRTRDLVFVEERPWASATLIGGPMLLAASSLKVVRAHGSDEVLAPDLLSTASGRVPLPAGKHPRSCVRPLTRRLR
jgi:hypothetical protein